MRKENNWKPVIQTLICDCGRRHKRAMKCLCTACRNGMAWRKTHPHYSRDWERKLKEKIKAVSRKENYGRTQIPI